MVLNTANLVEAVPSTANLRSSCWLSRDAFVSRLEWWALLLENVLRGLDWWLGGRLTSGWRQAFASSMLEGFRKLGDEVPTTCDFVEVAMRPWSSSSSDADCERPSWQQRRVLCPASCHMRQRMEKNRVRARILGFPNSANSSRDCGAT
jgi:hypothetical protein